MELWTGTAHGLTETVIRLQSKYHTSRLAYDNVIAINNESDVIMS